MQKHLSKIRIMELGMNLAGKDDATEAELEHIESCSVCAETLEQELRLTACLLRESENYGEDLPDGFLRRTRAQFLSAVEEKQLQEKRQPETEQTNRYDQDAKQATSVIGRSNRGIQKELKPFSVLTLVAGLSFAMGTMIIFFLLFPSYLVSLLVAFARTLVTFQVGLIVLAKTPSLAMATFAYAAVTLLFCTGLLSHITNSLQPPALSSHSRTPAYKYQSTQKTQERTPKKSKKEPNVK